MPIHTEYVEPDVVLTHRGVLVYATYKNNDSANRLSYHFTWDVEEEGDLFDVRELPGYTPDHTLARWEFHKWVLQKHIDTCLDTPGAALPWAPYQKGATA